MQFRSSRWEDLPHLTSTALGLHLTSTKMLKIAADPDPTVDSPDVTLAQQDGQPLKVDKVPKNLPLSANTQEGIRSTLTQGVVHHYLLNDDKACKVMTQSAKRPPIEKGNISSTTTHLQLSTGVFSKYPPYRPPK